MKAVFIVASIFVAVALLLAQAPSLPDTTAPRCGRQMAMPAAKRAEIRVLPKAVVEQERTDIERMQMLLAKLEEQRPSVPVRELVVRQQMELEMELATTLRSFLERQQSGSGKSPLARSIEARLNQMEGQRMCGACHGHGGMRMAN